ncbi:PilZ domain-containing protein [Melittangium boletus]|uniref:PilZ domain-containing protein n=1 Tax=Melittangium boletus DSM 14713 TaxID=1294270 RepID=A0A250I9V9_9BACT|nr:PilZ domain-containing protein [Melittangium boletus]ATB27917.1 hypothetical protein MEBOL_001362 [Melittangium boletus DSM 14713]
MSEPSRDDRRASARVSMRLGIREADTSDAFDSREGNISLGGFAWHGAALSVGTLVEVSFSLPGLAQSFRVRGQVLNVSYGARGTSAHARFLDLPADVEQHIARYLDEVEKAES